MDSAYMDTGMKGMAAFLRSPDLSAPKSSADKAKMETAAKDFESVFLSQMLQLMFGESQDESLTGDPESEEIYRGLMVDEYAKSIANSGGIGVADYVMRTLMQAQEA
jgi:Rod binding domain-containing protein